MYADVVGSYMDNNFVGIKLRNDIMFVNGEVLKNPRSI